MTALHERWLAHFTTTHRALARCFPQSTLAAIEGAIGAAEQSHGAEIRFAVETALPAGHLLQAVTPRQRALQVFRQLGMDSTDARNGILVYVLLAERDIEIIADEGFTARVPDATWEGICREMESAFRAGRYEAGTLAALEAISALARNHFPPGDGDRNELPNRPVVL